MLTLVTIPKPFAGHAGVIQRNAVISWTRLSRPVRVILFGDDPSVSEFAASEGLECVSDIPTTDYGTPLLDFVFDYVAKHATTPLAGYVNADIIFTDSLISSLLALRAKRKFLLVGQRVDLDLDKPLDFDSNWQRQIEHMADSKGKPSGQYAIDYFMFPTTSVPKLLPFAVGRPGWDNWTLRAAMERKVPIVDASKSILAAHQNHDYHHVPQKTASNWEGPEADYNRRLALANMRGQSTLDWSFLDAGWVLFHGHLWPAISSRRLLRRLMRSVAFRRGVSETYLRCLTLEALVRSLPYRSRILGRLGRLIRHIMAPSKVSRPQAIVFGAGAGGIRAAMFLAKQHDVIGFADNSAAKQQTRLMGRRIYAPNQLRDISFDQIFIASMYAPEILIQLEALQLADRVTTLGGDVISGMHERCWVCLLLALSMLGTVAVVFSIMVRSLA